DERCRHVRAGAGVPATGRAEPVPGPVPAHRVPRAAYAADLDPQLRRPTGRPAHTPAGGRVTV
ncbi:MAG: hypothetical protein AVDCRST_MAG41-2151, partial [uncultured Corynebacteriales bacterium]